MEGIVTSTDGRNDSGLDIHGQPSVVSQEHSIAVKELERIAESEDEDAGIIEKIEGA